MELSIVSPIYRGEKMLEELVSRIEAAVETITDDYEIILVNDQSPDNSWLKIQKYCLKDKHVKGINLSRNYGQECAIKAGLTKVSGNWIVVMDCDLQDRPEEIPNLYNKAKEGFDIVQAQRVERQDGYWKKLSSTFYHAVFNWLSGADTDKSIGNFGIYRHKVISEYIKLPELSPDFVILIPMLGFRQTAMPIQHDARAEGKSSYTLLKLLKSAFSSILCNTNKPLRMMAYLGMVLSGLSFALAFYNVIAKITGFITVDGYTTTVFSIWFVGGLIMAQLGILGLYIGKVFDQVKGRPSFIIMDELNF